jgi:hypothetical protein
MEKLTRIQAASGDLLVGEVARVFTRALGPLAVNPGNCTVCTLYTEFCASGELLLALAQVPVRSDVPGRLRASSLDHIRGALFPC